MCSRKCAVPFVCASSYLEPARSTRPPSPSPPPGHSPWRHASPFASVVTYTCVRAHSTYARRQSLRTIFPIARARPSRARPPPSRPSLSRAASKTPLSVARVPRKSPTPFPSLSLPTHLRLDTARDPAMRERHRLRTPESHEDVPRARGAVPVLSRLVPGPHGAASRAAFAAVATRWRAIATTASTRARARSFVASTRETSRGRVAVEGIRRRSVGARSNPSIRSGRRDRAPAFASGFYSATHRPAGVLYGKETPSSRHASTDLCDVHCDDSICTPTVRRIRASMYKEKERKERKYRTLGIMPRPRRAETRRIDETKEVEETDEGARATRGDDDGRRRRR